MPNQQQDLNLKNWKIILIISGIIMMVVNYILGQIFPYGWKYMKCPPLTCDYREPFGYEESIFYGFFYTFSFLLIVIGGTFLLAKFISNLFEKKTKIAEKSEPIIPSSSKRIKPLWVIIGIFALAAIGLFIIYGLYIKSEKEFMRERIENLEKFAKTLNSTANWQTYRNEKYGFEFKYPKGWELGEFDSMGILVYDPQKFSKEKCEETGNQCFYAIGAAVLQPRSPSDLETLVNKLEGKEMTMLGKPDRTYKFISKNKLKGRNVYGYEIEYKADDGGILKSILVVEEGKNMIELNFEYFGEEEYKDIFDQILSTFKFVK
jgi:hypothetical protein